MIVVRFVLVVLLRAFLIYAIWNELFLPLISLQAFRVRILPAILIALLLTISGLDRPILRPAHKFIAH